MNNSPLWVWCRSNCCILNTGNSWAAMTGDEGPLRRTTGTTNRTDKDTGKFLNSSRKSGTFSHIFFYSINYENAQAFVVVRVHKDSKKFHALDAHELNSLQPSTCCYMSAVIFKITGLFSPGGRGQLVRFGWPYDYGHYDVTANEARKCTEFWRRRLLLIQLFETNFSNYSSFKWYCIWIWRSNYHRSFLRGKYTLIITEKFRIKCI